MKKILFSAMLLTGLGITSAFASEPLPEETAAAKNFKKEFAGAEYVKWNSIGDYQKASFLLGGHRAEAYFDADGMLAGSVRDLFYDQLPLAVMKTVDSRFSNADIIDVREISNADGTSYKVELESASKRYTLKLSSAGDLLEKKAVKFTPRS